MRQTSMKCFFKKILSLCFCFGFYLAVLSNPASALSTRVVASRLTGTVGVQMEEFVTHVLQVARGEGA